MTVVVVICASHTLFFLVRIYFVRISKQKSAKFEEYFKNETEVDILERIKFCVL